MKVPRVPLLILVALLIFSLAWPAAAQGPAPDGSAGWSAIDAAAPYMAAPSPDAAPEQAPDGRRFMSVNSQPQAAAVPQNSGGPDDFGYTWTDNVALSWVNASGGTNTGINNSTDRAGPIDIGFSFKYYEKVRSQLYISRYGFLAFSSDSLWNDQSEIPSFEKPNEVIAPHWAPLDQVGGYVHYLRGGTAPNRWFVVEWNRVRSTYEGVDEYTFEAILRESGDIVFQYATMTATGYYWCQASGIEDATGLDGLEITPFCNQVASNHAVRITRPAPDARVALAPRAQGAFGAAGAAVQFNQTVRNIGELGADTFDLTVRSSWSTTLYRADGSTPLTDTDGDDVPDTGPVGQGSSATIVVRTMLPTAAAVGASNTAQVTATSSRNPATTKTARFQTGVPARFAQTYSRSDRPWVGLYRPDRQAMRQTTDQYGYNLAVATTPGGNIVQVWCQYRTIGNNRNVDELYYAVLDNHGNVVRPATRLTDLSGANTSAYDYIPAVAVGPDGRIGIIWDREFYNSSNGTYNFNIYFMVLAANGATVLAPTNLTNNGSWGTYNAASVPHFYYPTIAATADSRFGLAWERYVNTNNSYSAMTWYAVRRSDGGQVKAPTQFSADTRSYYPNLTALADGALFLVQYTSSKLGYGRIDSSGNIITALTTLATSSPNYPDAVQLPNGNIVIAWTNGNVRYAVLNAGLEIIKGVSWLPNISSVGDDLVSVTPSGNRAVLTWGDACCGNQPNLYTALLDDSGNVVTSPQIFFSDHAGHSVQLPYNGQGNTPLLGDLTPPANPTGLASPSHTLNTWSNDATVDVTWVAASDDDTGVGGYAVAWDHAAATVPDATQDLGAVMVTTSPALADGDWYFHIRAVDKAGNWAAGAAHLGPFRIDVTPPVSTARSPRYALAAFPVIWGGSDGGSGVASYDVWVRIGAVGVWTKWQTATTATSASYTAGTAGNTYTFRSQARDRVGNVETELPADGDTLTTLAALQVTGRVVNNRQQPIFNAAVSAAPPLLNTAMTDGRGNYTLFGATTGVHDLTAGRAGYGVLPPIYGVEVSGNLSGVDFVLPPEEDIVVNGGWETGDLTGWQAAPGAAPYMATAIVEAAAAHTGLAGLRLIAPPGDGPEPLWQVSQTITLPVSLAESTLSWLVRVVSGDPAGSLVVEVSNGSVALTRTIPLAAGGWTHAWEDLSAFNGQTVTLRLGFQGAAAREVYVDEISIGATRRGSYPIYLPLVAR